jgi:predicted nucleotidyltransferase
MVRLNIGIVKREAATLRLEELLTNVAAGGRHAKMVDEVWLFGSYARGAPTPGDVDLEIVITPDEKYQRDEVQAFFGHRHPGIDFLRELRGRRRGLQIGVNRSSEIDFPEKMLLYRRGDDLSLAMDRLHAIPVDPDAVAVPRDPVVPELEGLDKELTRSERAELSALSSADWLDIERLTLEDEALTSEAEVALDRLYAEGSPLGRAATLALTEMGRRGIAASVVRVGPNHLGNQWALRRQRPDPDRLIEPTHAVGWSRPVEDGASFLAYGGAEYWHVLKPKKKGPVTMLVLRIGRKAPDGGLKEFCKYSPGGRYDILPGLRDWVEGRA